MSKKIKAKEYMNWNKTITKNELSPLEVLEDLRKDAKHHLDIIEKSLKALEIIKETPIFAWYVTIYKDAYEMVADAKGFRTNNSVEELQEKFNLLKEVLL